MNPTDKYRRAISVAMICLLISHIGCSTFQPLATGADVRDVDPQVRKIRITAPDGLRYDFAVGQYTVTQETDSLWTCAGWGEQYGTFGLVGVGFYRVPIDAGTMVEVETIDAVRSVLFTGIVSGATIVAFLGIRHLSSSSDKGGGNSQPPAVN